MKGRIAALFGMVVLAVVACNVDSVNVPTVDQVAPAMNPLLNIDSECQQGYDCVNPNSFAPIAADLDTVGTNCTLESGCGRGWSAIYTGIQIDAQGALDAVNYTCTNGQTTRDTAVLSNRGCWDCMFGCAGPSCPPGAQCITLPAQSNVSDCTQVYCNQGYTAVVWWSSGIAVPKCVRAMTVAPPPPVTTASNLNGWPYLTWAPVDGAAGYRVYRQLHTQAQPQVWYTWLNATSYHDASTSVSGEPESAPNPAWSQWVRYHVVSLSADNTESGYVNVHYFNGTGPY